MAIKSYIPRINLNTKHRRTMSQQSFNPETYLESCSYRRLQTLSKQNGIKANQSGDVLKQQLSTMSQQSFNPETYLESCSYRRLQTLSKQNNYYQQNGHQDLYNHTKAQKQRNAQSGRTKINLNNLNFGVSFDIDRPGYNKFGGDILQDNRRYWVR
eukprot:TRINITY_DN1191_c0_g1_i4.p1 TRINITY_DN1191_c0_g1~~TRINITY_DN1191_c0_g1_i4.p1  ORF type:complete len:156 (-),score=23.64 TRINITY_DN1191_c0_g1_i4:41-508(-)